MKRILICLLGVITVSEVKEGWMTFVTGVQSDDPAFPIDQYEKNHISQDSTTSQGHSATYASETFGFTKEILSEHSDEQKFLLPSKGASNKDQASAKLPDEGISNTFFATAKAEPFIGLMKAEHQVENFNRSTEFPDTYQRDDYIVSTENTNTKIEMRSEAVEASASTSNDSAPTIGTGREEPRKSSPQHEDIPSFSEWTQKQLAEAERKKADQNETREPFTKGRHKFRNKNYASPDCGAKIVAANPESVSSSSVLSSLKDEYMLNYCTNRIWFIVELCEAIQAKQLDLANFELFSSSPKHFSVFVSHRFPTRDWSNVGKFTAQDSRDVQTFNLHPHLFGKFVKVEMHSHYGREQFCPISWAGIYGTSEYEVLAKEDERNSAGEDDYGDSYDEEIFLGHKRNSPKNLFSSATEAVLSIVKKATAPFMKSENNDTESENCTVAAHSLHSRCVSPRYIVVCNNCSQNFYDGVYKVLSCESFALERLASGPFVRRALLHGENCADLGLNFSSARKGAPFPSNYLTVPDQAAKYLTVMLRSAWVAALCNVLAVSENKVVVNTTANGIEGLRNLTQREPYCEEVGYPPPEPATSGFSMAPCSLAGDCAPLPSSRYQASTYAPEEPSTPDAAPDIEPTRTLVRDGATEESREKNGHQKSSDITGPGFPESEAEREKPSGGGAAKAPAGDWAATPSPYAPASQDAEGKTDRPESSGARALVSEQGGTDLHKEPESGNRDNSSVNAADSATLESIISDLNAIEKVANSPASSFASSNLPAESIFLRLASRIKNLEINMSLSSTYLEELSRRYRTQLEFLSKSLNVTIQKMEEFSRAEEEKERRRAKEMLVMRMQLANLTRDVSTFLTERNSWRPQASSVSQHIVFVSVEFLFIWLIFSYWKKSEDTVREKSNSGKKVKRRRSLEGVRGHEMPRRKARRPSEEALDIALSRTGFKAAEPLRVDKKRKKRKKESKCSLNGFNPRRRVSEAEVVQATFGHHAALPPEAAASCEGPPPFSGTAYAGLTYAKENIPVRSPTGTAIAAAAAPSSPASFSYSSSASSSDATLDVALDGPVEAFASPAFMKTALATRNGRMREKESSHESVKRGALKERKGSNSLKKYMKKFF